MRDFIPAATPPPAPGWYWTAVITRSTPDERGIVDVHYRHAWRWWDGEKWAGVGDDPTHYYGEAKT